MTNTPIELAREILRQANRPLEARYSDTLNQINARQAASDNIIAMFAIQLAQSVIDITEAPFMIIEHKGELLGCSEKVFDAYNEVCANRQQANQEQREADINKCEELGRKIDMDKSYPEERREAAISTIQCVIEAIRESN